MTNPGIVKHLSSIQRSNINNNNYDNIYLRNLNDFLSEIDPDVHIVKDNISKQL